MLFMIIALGVLLHRIDYRNLNCKIFRSVKNNFEKIVINLFFTCRTRRLSSFNNKN